MKERNGK